MRSKAIIRHKIAFKRLPSAFGQENSCFALEMRERNGEPYLVLISKCASDFFGSFHYVSKNQLRLLAAEASAMLAKQRGGPLPHGFREDFVWFKDTPRKGDPCVLWISGCEAAPILLDCQNLQVLCNSVERFLSDCQKSVLQD